MKTTIVIEDGKVTVQADDGAPVLVQPTPIKHPAALHPPVSPEDRKAVYSQPPKAAIPATNCIICGAAFQPIRRNQALCGAPECKKQKQREYAKSQAKKQPARSETEIGEAVLWCKHCEDYTTHSTIGHNAATLSRPDWRSNCHGAKVKVVGGDEGTNHYECLACAQSCNVYDKNSPPDSSIANPDFKDPWSCARCRSLGSICALHANLEMEGKTAPTVRHES